MDYHFSESILSLTPSDSGDMLKMAQDPTYLSFSAGNPSAETFPIAEMRQVADRIFADREKAGKVLQYGAAEGYAPLRELTARRLREKYATGGPEDALIITTGGQQAIDLLCRCLIDKGDTVLVEAPSFMGALDTFGIYQAHLASAPMQPDGMDLNAVEQILKTDGKVKLIYCISTFQNPTGYTTSLEKRKELLRLAEQYDVLILEDNPYLELRYRGEYVPNIKSLDQTGRVVYVGSYSKTLSPGIRIGFALANRTLIQKMVSAKMTSDVHTNLFFQAVAAEYLSEYDFDAHIARAVELYRARRDLLVSRLQQLLPECVTISDPEGGLFAWMDLPEGCDGAELARRLLERRVVVVPGNVFLVDSSARSRGVRLNFSQPGPEAIERGTGLIAACVKEYLQEKRQPI